MYKTKAFSLKIALIKKKKNTLKPAVAMFRGSAVGRN